MFINKILKDDKNTSSLEKPKWSSMKSHPFQNHFFSTLKLIQNTKPVVHSFCAPKIYLSYFYSWNNYGVRNFHSIHKNLSEKYFYTLQRKNAAVIITRLTALHLFHQKNVLVFNTLTISTSPIAMHDCHSQIVPSCQLCCCLKNISAKCINRSSHWRFIIFYTHCESSTLREKIRSPLD